MFAQGRPARPAEPGQGRCLVSRWLWLRGSSNSRKAARPPSLSPCRCPLQRTPSAACADDRAREITSFLSSMQTSKQARLVEAGELAQLGPGAAEPWGRGVPLLSPLQQAQGPRRAGPGQGTQRSQGNTGVDSPKRARTQRPQSHRAGPTPTPGLSKCRLSPESGRGPRSQGCGRER